MPLRTPTLVTAVVATLLAVIAAPALSAGAVAPPTMTIRPAALPRGDDPTVPYVDGDVIVDGERRVPLPAANGVLLGADGDDYVVWTSEGGGTPRVWRVAADGAATSLLRSRDAYGTVLSSDGDELLVPRNRVEARKTVLSLRDSTSGEILVQTTVPGFARVLDLHGGEAVLGTTSPARTLRWDLSTGLRERVSARTAYQADLSTNRLAVFTDDPYQGGCSVVSTLSDPTTPLSQSCTERVAEFSPDGRRLALVDLLTDGLGPQRVTVRTAVGRRVVTYEAPRYFGLITWETSRALLLQTNTTTRSALVRCVRTHCERASRVGPASGLATVAMRTAFSVPVPRAARP